jgi:hypothetical protein
VCRHETAVVLFLFMEDEIMAGVRNNPAVKVNVDDYRDMMFVMVSVEVEPATEQCLYCQRSLGVCECIPGERAILLDDSGDEDYYTVIDADAFEPV